ncbi:hypothetical protein CRYUN_Cryun02cG0035000 [Craigia yunnanensis]
MLKIDGKNGTRIYLFKIRMYYAGSHIFPDVLLNDIAGPDGNPLLLSLKLAVDVFFPVLVHWVSPHQQQSMLAPLLAQICTFGNIVYFGTFAHYDIETTIMLFTGMRRARQGLLIRGGDVLERLASVDHVAFDKTGTLTERKPTVSSLASFAYDESEILQIAAAVERTATHPIAKAIVKKAESLNLAFPETRVQLVEPDHAVMHQSSSPSNYSKTAVYVGRDGEGVIGAIGISDSLCYDAESTVSRLQQKGIKTILISGDREEAVATIAKTVGDGINDAPSLALADVGIALQTEAQETAASDAASIILLGNKLSQVVGALDLAQATMAKVYQNLSWAVAYNAVAIPIAAGVLLPQYDFAMTPSLSGGLMALSSIFVVTNSLLLRLRGSEKSTKNNLAKISQVPAAPS